jgi:hypothetical protein
MWTGTVFGMQFGCLPQPNPLGFKWSPVWSPDHMMIYISMLRFLSTLASLQDKWSRTHRKVQNVSSFVLKSIDVG